MEEQEPKMEMPTHLNPMVFYPRFQHITEQIFEHFDKQSLKNCRVVSKSWQESIDYKNILWNEVFKNKDCSRAFQSSCKNGHTKIAKFLMKKSIEFNIELNAKDEYGRTAFHLASSYGNTKIVKILIEHSKIFGLDLTLKDNDGRTGFQLAKRKQQREVIKLIKRKMPSIAVEN